MAKVRRSPSELVTEIESLWIGFLQVKGRFPAASVGAIGQRGFDTPPYYLAQGVPSIVHILDHPMSEEDQKLQNRYTTWLNEAYVIRLRALIEESKISDRKDARFDLEALGEDAKSLMLLLKELRDRFAHWSVDYRETGSDRNLASRLIERYWDSTDSARPALGELDDWPLHVDKVLEPMTHEVRDSVDQIDHGAGD